MTTFDLTEFIKPGIVYGQVMLKQAYYDACGAHDEDGTLYYGSVFRRVVLAHVRSGEIAQSKAKNREGNETGFFQAVIDMYHYTDDRYRAIAGTLVLLGVNEKVIQKIERQERDAYALRRKREIENA